MSDGFTYINPVHCQPSRVPADRTHKIALRDDCRRTETARTRRTDVIRFSFVSSDITFRRSFGHFATGKIFSDPNKSNLTFESTDSTRALRSAVFAAAEGYSTNQYTLSTLQVLFLQLIKRTNGLIKKEQKIKINYQRTVSSFEKLTTNFYQLFNGKTTRESILLVNEIFSPTVLNFINRIKQYNRTLQ